MARKLMHYILIAMALIQCVVLILAPHAFAFTNNVHGWPPTSTVVQLGNPFISKAPSRLRQVPTSQFAIPTVVQTAFQSTAVQKVLELGMISGIGAALREKIDAKATTALLLNALVPAVIVSSLSTLTLSPEMGLVLLAGVLLALMQLGAGELAARFVVGGEEGSQSIHRTAALQLGSMAPALSVFSFTREFVGATFAGMAALADIPTKIYTLLLIPHYIRFRGEKAGSKENESTSVIEKAEEEPSILRRLWSIASDPFNLAITSGLILAALGKPVATLGFFGKAIATLAQAQTAILFLLIGLKLQVRGDRPRLCMRLLLARHGFCNLAMSAFLALFMANAGADYRLAAVLSSQAASSIIAFGQMSKLDKAGIKGYDCELAFDIVAMSFPFTVLLNTIACLAGNSYVEFLPMLGAIFLGVSAGMGSGIFDTTRRGFGLPNVEGSAEATQETIKAASIVIRKD